MHKLLISILCLISILNAQSFNSVRCAYINWDGTKGIPQDFIKRAKLNGFNYILAEFPPSRTNSADFEAAFRIVTQHGLKLIPYFQVSSRHSGGWAEARDASKPIAGWTTNVQMNNTAGDGQQNGWSAGHCNSFANDPGFQKNFDLMLNELLIGMTKVITDPNQLEYINLGHDEAIGVTSANPTKLCLTVGFGDQPDYLGNRGSKADVDWINSNVKNYGNDYQVTIRALMNRELLQRVRDVHKAGFKKAKVMIFGDMWEPELYKSSSTYPDLPSFVTRPEWNKGKVTLALNSSTDTKEIIDLPGLSTTIEKNTVKDSVVLMPWSYGCTTYNPDVTFKYITTAGFKKCGYTVCIQNVGNLDNDNNIAHYAYKSRCYSSNIIGYISAHWSFWNPPDPSKSLHYIMYNQPYTYNTMEYCKKIMVRTTTTKALCAY